MFLEFFQKQARGDSFPRIEDISQQLGVTHGTTKTHKERTVNKLRNLCRQAESGEAPPSAADGSPRRRR
jgi:hypothetical protein